MLGSQTLTITSLSTVRWHIYRTERISLAPLAQEKIPRVSLIHVPSFGHASGNRMTYIPHWERNCTNDGSIERNGSSDLWPSSRPFTWPLRASSTAALTNVQRETGSSYLTADLFAIKANSATSRSSFIDTKLWILNLYDNTFTTLLRYERSNETFIEYVIWIARASRDDTIEEHCTLWLFNCLLFDLK